MRFLTPEEVAALADAVGPDWECLIYTAAYTGLRWGELAGLRVGRVDLDRRTIAVVEQLNELSGRMEWGPPKTAAGRRAVSLPARLAEMLATQLERPMVARSGLVFPTPLGEPMRQLHRAGDGVVAVQHDAFRAARHRAARTAARRRRSGTTRIPGRCAARRIG